MMSINVRSILKLCKLSMPHLTSTGGNIVNVSSAAAFLTTNDMLGYTISKAAVTKLTECLAMELGPRGVRVNEVK